MIGNAVVEVEPAKPPKSQMQFDFLAQPPLKADAIAVATISIRIISSGSIEGRPISL